MSRTSFGVNLHSIVCLNVKKLLARNRRHIWSLSDKQREIMLWQLPQMKLINNEVNVYYLDNKWKTIVFTFCVVANCPPPEIVMKKRRGKEQEMYLITYSMHQGFCELLTNLMFMIVSLLRLDNDFLLLVSRKSSSISFFLWT